MFLSNLTNATCEKSVFYGLVMFTHKYHSVGVRKWSCFCFKTQEMWGLTDGETEREISWCSLWEYGRMFAYLAVVIFSSKLHQGFFRQMKTSRGRFSLAFFRRWSLTGLHFTFRSNQIGFTRLSFKTLQRALKTLSGGRGSFSDLNSDHMLLEWIGSRNFHTTFRLINTWRFPRWRCVVHFSAVAITTAGESDCEERKWANVTKLKAAASDTFTLKQVLNSCVPTEVTVGGRLVDKSCFSYEKYIFW